MAIEIIDLGTVPLDGSDGDVAREAFEKVNANFAEHESEIDAISPRLTTIETDIGQLEIQAGTIESSLTNLTESFNVLSAEVGGYSADIQNLENSREYTLVAGEGITIDRSTPTAPIISSTGSSGSVWGQITGDITDQADLFDLLQDRATVNSLEIVEGKVDRILSSTSVNEGAGAVPYNEALEYPAGSVGFAVKAGEGALREDLANQTDPEKGAGIIAYRTETPYVNGTVGAKLRELSIRVITPEQYGAVGDGASDDTAAWIAVCAAMQSGYTLKASGDYLISGSGVLVSGIENFTLDLSGARLRQQVNNSRTIRIEGCSKLSIKGGLFYGRGGASGEYVPAATSYNGVAGIFLSQCDYAQIYNNRLFDHAGGSIVWRDSDHLFIHGNEVVGIGPGYIPALGNGQDFAIGGFSDNPSRMDFTFNISNNLIRDTAFGIFANRSKSLIISGNTIDRIPGQHGVYTIECSGVSVTGNTFLNCTQSAFKMQLENYAGRSLAPAGSLNHVGLTYTGNTIRNCQDGFSVLSTSLSDGTDQKVFGVVVSGNSISDCSQDGMQINHCVDANIGDNTINGAVRFGLVFRNSSGVISNNQLIQSGAAAISGSLYGDTTLIDNKLIDCGLNNQAGLGNDVPLLFSVPTSPLPSASSTPALRMYGNDVLFNSGATGAAYTVYIMHTSVQLSIVATKTNSGKVVRCDGVLVNASDNDFPGFFAGAQNSPAPFLRGRVGRDFYGQQNPQAAGSTQAFIRGDICWNSSVLATGIVFWVCTVSGSPGTWSTGVSR